MDNICNYAYATECSPLLVEYGAPYMLGAGNLMSFFEFRERSSWNDGIS